MVICSQKITAILNFGGSGGQAPHKKSLMCMKGKKKKIEVLFKEG